MGKTSNPQRAARSDQLRSFRRRMGLKQWALADMLGVNQATVSRWERGCATVNDRHWRKLADIERALTTERAKLAAPAGAIPDRHWPTFLKHFRATHKISQERLSEILGCTVHTVGRWECGQCRPSLEYLIRLNHVIQRRIDTNATFFRKV